MLDTDLVHSFMHTFYGYGSWSARLWFVGMEEGGGDNIDQLSNRLAIWNGEELEDLQKFHEPLGGTNWFGAHPPVQRTWGKLIRIALCADARPSDLESVRVYQREELGRRDGASALIELFPLPSPSTKQWTYREAGMPQIATRETYREFLGEERTVTIQRRIDHFGPRAVVFYGLSYRPYWEKIAGTPFLPVQGARFRVAWRNSTVLILAPHPVARGVRDAEFRTIGEHIRQTTSLAPDLESSPHAT